MSERGTEIRTAAHAVELRAAPEGSSGIGTLAGYAAVFNRNSQNLGGFVEVVDPAAFTKTLSDGGPVMARGNHDDAHLLGTTWAGTLRLAVDEVGLRYEVDLPDTSSGRDFKELAARGDIKWSSFAFRTVSDEWTEAEEGYTIRTLREVQLVDVAPVNSPAYLDTTVAVRSLEQHRSEPPAADELDPPAADSEATRSTPVSIRLRLLDLEARR